MSRTLGYVRELHADEDVSAEVTALRRAGASRVYVDRDAGVWTELTRCLDALTPGDILLVSHAVALAPSVEQFVATTARLQRRGIQFHSLAEPALSTVSDLAAAPGDTLEALDGLRRRLIGLRTREGLSAAAAAGRRPGRPRVMTDERVEVARELRAQKRSFAQIGRALGVSEAAVRRALTPTASTHGTAE